VSGNHKLYVVIDWDSLKTRGIVRKNNTIFVSFNSETLYSSYHRGLCLVHLLGHIAFWAGAVCQRLIFTEINEWTNEWINWNWKWMFLLPLADSGYRRLPLPADVDGRGGGVRRPDGRRTGFHLLRRRRREAHQSTGYLRRAAATHGSSRRAGQHDRSREFVHARAQILQDNLNPNRPKATDEIPVLELRGEASPAMWDHTVIPATRHKWTRPALTTASKPVPTPAGWKAELT